MSASFKTTIEREKQVLRGEGHAYDDVCVEIGVTVTYAYHKAQRETHDIYGWTPAEPEQVEILSCIETETGNDIKPTESEEDKLEQEALDDVRCRYEAAMEDRAENERSEP